LRETSSSRFYKPTHAAGIVRAGVQSCERDLNPFPFAAMMFSRGTRTSLNVTTPL
jgi:hypothetical protein